METVKIGEYVLPVVPQRHARLRHHLSQADFQALFSGNYGHESYRLLGILIPALPDRISEWEWEGYASEQAYEKRDYQEELDKSPTTAQIVDAFEKALMVSGAGRLGKLIDLIQTGTKLAETEMVATTKAQSGMQTQSSPDSPGGNGGST